MGRTPLSFSAAISLLALLAVPALASGAPQDPQAPPPLRFTEAVLVEAPRPKPLPMLYGGFCALQAGDAITTIVACRNGAREMNPVLSGMTSPVTLGLFKAGGTAVAIYGVERLWKTGHRKMAVVTMVVANSVMTWVVVNNIGVVRR